MCSEGYRTWSVCLCVCVCVCVCVCYHAFYHYVQQDRQRATPTDSALYWLDFKTDNFIKVLRSGVIAWKTSKQANMLMSLSSPEAVFTHFRDQQSTDTTWRTTGESSIVSEASYRGRGPANRKKGPWIAVRKCAFCEQSTYMCAIVWTI